MPTHTRRDFDYYAFVDAIAAAHAAWGLSSGAPALTGPYGRFVPLWSVRPQDFIIAERWPGRTTALISMPMLIGDVLPTILRERLLINPMSDADLAGAPIEPRRLLDDLIDRVRQRKRRGG